LAVWELKRVAMAINLIPLELPETRNLPLDLPFGQEPESPIALHLAIEGNLSARSQTDCNVGLSDCRKSARAGLAKTARDELISNSRRPIGDMVQL
jgi:hypothetical protein